MKQQVLAVVATLMSGLNILDKQGKLGTKTMLGKQSYEYYDGERHWYGQAFYLDRKLIIIADTEG